ncbi:low molecular weight protein arginine phosphatase [Paenibacillus dokdonensis]|uniref:Low molecular weight protein arginine phosphatase n=1 Tax=Paenibacillus dokdonensis TaxID=2567944 RepID=A0ABU6GSK7_9BACL|nr:low molecular weight protein arginine phosphatase [Paenibacillus dokdonensis]MEC0242734.1 low molecular weight protein arginine phosphatase [Paenibacillus dokdonensis]
MKHILFVCTGNTCRSPMAEAFLRKMAKDRGIGVEVRSAGVAAMDGVSMSRHAEAVLRDHDIEDRLMSKSLKLDAVNWSDLILTLTQGHKQHVIRSFPQAADKVYTLKEYAENDEAVLNDLNELDSLYATWEVKRSLGQELTDEERERLIEIQQRVPSFDISDPYGGSREDYDMAAAEIRTAIERLLDKLESFRTS